jgi:thiamine biosynthesis lipoprotein ApbE
MTIYFFYVITSTLQIKKNCNLRRKIIKKRKRSDRNKKKVEEKIKGCIKEIQRKNKSFSKLDKLEAQDLCDEYY